MVRVKIVWRGNQVRDDGGLDSGYSGGDEERCGFQIYF